LTVAFCCTAAEALAEATLLLEPTNIAVKPSNGLSENSVKTNSVNLLILISFSIAFLLLIVGMVDNYGR